MSSAILIQSDAGFVGSAADLAAFPVPSADPSDMARTATDFIIDALVAEGFAAGALPADGADLPAGGLINLGLDNPRALSEVSAKLVGAVDARALGAAPKVARDGNGRGGVSFATGSALVMRKVGLTDTQAFNPVEEGYRDFLVVGWARPATVTANAGLFGAGSGAGRLWGLATNGGGHIAEAFSNRQVVAGYQPGVWYHLGLWYHFDTVAGTITTRIFAGGSEVGAATVAATSLATYAGYSNGQVSARLGSLPSFATFSGTIARLERVFTGIPGHEIDPAAYIAADYAATKGRVAGL